MKNKAIDSFKVVLNWKGIFEAVTCVFGIMMCLILFLCLIVEYIRTGEIEDLEKKELIERKHKANLFKLEVMPSYKPEWD